MNLSLPVFYLAALAGDCVVSKGVTGQLIARDNVTIVLGSYRDIILTVHFVPEVTVWGWWDLEIQDLANL